jgi:hypothetical protein
MGMSRLGKKRRERGVASEDGGKLSRRMIAV